ncbi:MAG: hypothetical protein ACHQ6U_13270, partial [Thermodesulfobacteriota bacterium]
SFNWFSVKDLSEKVGKSPTYRTLQRYLAQFTEDGHTQHNGEKPPNSKYALSTPVSSCRNTHIFTPNFLKSLNNNDDKTNCRNNDIMSSFSKDYDNHDKSRQNRNVATDSNNDEELDVKRDMTTITTEGPEEYIPPKNLKEAGSTDPLDWEEEEQDFLNARVAEGI